MGRKRIDRTGEINLNKQGIKMKIVNYRNASDIDIQFEDGYIVEHRSYENFKKGITTRYNYEIERIGETNINSKGMKMTIINYRSNRDIDVQFEDGEIVYNKEYRAFKQGKISHPSIKVRREESLGIVYPQIAKMIAIKQNNINIEDTFKMNCMTSKYFYFKCNRCGKISNKKYLMTNMIKGEYSCQYCCDGISKPEKILINILEQLKVFFIHQATNTSLQWAGNKRYDFYIPNMNIIIETHGEQHYRETGTKSKWKTLKHEKANDRYKKNLAKKNGIKRYYSIDCRNVNLEYIKLNIIKVLGNIFDLSNINWELAWEKTQSSLCTEAWQLWNNETHSTKDIAERLKLNIHTIEKYLKEGAELGKCDYTVKKGKEASYWKLSNENNPMARKVINLETKEIFGTVKQAYESVNGTSTGFYQALKEKRKYKGYTFIYYEEYLNDNIIEQEEEQLEWI